jgi:HEAT repeat protein
LRGLSNAGYPRALAAVRPFVEAKSDVVREAALEALCLVLDPEVDALYAERLRNEPRHDLRSLLLRRIAQHRKPTRALLRALDTQLTHEADENVSRAMIEVLGAWQDESSEARTLLERTARSAAPSLRELAAQALQANTSGATP